MNAIISPALQNNHALLKACEALDTASLSDALDSLGLAGGLAGLNQQVPGTRCIGFAYTVLYEPVQERNGFRSAANYIDEVPPDAVIVSSNPGRTDCTTWGDILTHVAISRGIRGTLIDGPRGYRYGPAPELPVIQSSPLHAIGEKPSAAQGNPDTRADIRGDDQSGRRGGVR